MNLKSRYLSVRKRIVPWCMQPGCWRKSHVFQRRPGAGRVVGGRGNICAAHLLEAIMSDDEDEDDDHV